MLGYSLHFRLHDGFFGASFPFQHMPIASLTTANIEALIGLVKKRESLQVELAKIEEQIESVFNKGAAPKASVAKVRKGRGKAKKAKVSAPVAKPAKASAPAAKAAKPAKKGKRGALKEAIIAELQAAGSKGVSVKDLSTKLGVKNQNLHVWFSTTGKTVKGLKKTGTGTWALS
jgi:hypothetical protein